MSLGEEQQGEMARLAPQMKLAKRIRLTKILKERRFFFFFWVFERKKPKKPPTFKWLWFFVQLQTAP